MYDLHLSSEQLEMRDTIREFVEHELKPVALDPKRLQPFDKPLLLNVLDQASQMGLRGFALPEEMGGASADHLTACIILEELAVGEVDVAMVLAHTSALAKILFEQQMTSQQRERFLPLFQEDDQYHLAFAGQNQLTDFGWSYHRPLESENNDQIIAEQQANGDWIINGSLPAVMNAPIAKLFMVLATTDRQSSGGDNVPALLVPNETKGLTVGTPPIAVGEPENRWHHGAISSVKFEDCRVPADALLGEQENNLFARVADVVYTGPELAAINLGIGRAAYETALDYAQVRRQGARNIIEHQGIGAKLADCVVKLELARSAIWKAAWFNDHPEAVEQNLSVDAMQHIARVYTAEAVHEVTLEAAECFGAMAVMRDMPLQKYVHDGLVFLHSDSNDSASKLRIAETVAGYRRPTD